MWPIRTAVFGVGAAAVAYGGVKFASATSSVQPVATALPKSEPALLQAAAACNLRSVKQVLQGPELDVNAVDRRFSRTALAFAADCGCHDVVEALVAAKAELDRQDRHGMTALELACWSAPFPLPPTMVLNPTFKPVVLLVCNSPRILCQPRMCSQGHECTSSLCISHVVQGF